MSIMNKSVLKIAQFLPVYWYESINETLAQYKTLPVPVAEEIWKSMGIEAMFIAAFVFMILAISKYKQQSWYFLLNWKKAPWPAELVYQLFSQLQGLCIKRKFQPVPENVPDPLPVENVLFR